MEALISNINIRFPLESLLLLAIIGFFNLKKGSLPTYPRHAFTIMYLAMLLNIFAELGTLACLYNFAYTPIWVTDLTHRVFIISLNLVTLQFFTYVLRSCLKRTRLPIVFQVLTLSPFLASIVLAFYGDIYYYVDETFVYSHGTFPTSIYACIACYIVASIVILSYKGCNLEKTQRRSLWLALLFWVITAIIQLLCPRLLLSSVSGASLVFFMYLSLENPRELFNENIGCFNAKAFQSVCSERFGTKNTFYVITVIMPGLSMIKTKFGQSTYNSFLKNISEYLVRRVAHKKSFPVFHLQSNTLTLVSTSSFENVSKFMETLENLLAQGWSVSGINCMLSAQVFAIECPKFAQDVDTINNTISYFSHTPEFHKRFFIDEEFTAKRQRYSTIQSLVKEAIENDGFDVYYQPIYSPKDKKFTSAEALVRLKDKSIGFISPEEFIPIAEQDDSIMDLGRIVFEKVCKLAASVNLEKLGIEYIEVNLSGVQCMNPDIYYLLRRIMRNYNIPPTFVNLEITETAAIDATDILEKNMSLLCGLGCTFSLDDFGTGYSNLTQIIKYPFRIIKLDKSLVWGYFDDSQPQISILTYNIITMINQLNLEIVAEGVETLEMVETLSAMKVGHLQGYYFSKPIPEEDFVKFITEGNKVEAVQ